MLGTKRSFTSALVALAVLLAVYLAVRMVRRPARTGPPAPLTREEPGPEAPAPSGLADAEPGIPALTPEESADLQAQLSEIESIAALDDRLTRLVHLVDRYRRRAGAAIPLIVPLLEDRTPMRIVPGVLGKAALPAGINAGEPTTPRSQALGLLARIGDEEAAQVLLGELHRQIDAGSAQDAGAVLSYLGARSPRVVEEVITLLERYQSEPGPIRNTLIDYFGSHMDRTPEILFLEVEKTRSIWESLATETDPFGAGVSARSQLDSQVGGLILTLELRNRTPEQKARAHELLRRISGQDLPPKPRAWEQWARENRAH